MIERLDVSDADLARWVQTAWGHEVTGIRFMPMGLDGWAYAVTTAHARFFLKVKRESPGLPAVLVPPYLRGQGITQVVAPLETAAVDAGYFMLLYPMIDGGGLWSSGLTDEQWTEYGEILHALHACALPTNVDLPRETFATNAPDRIQQMAEDAARSPYLIGIWPSDRVRRLADEVRTLAVRAVAVGAEMVLCHADIHPGNLLADAAGGLHVVDWDAPIIAPRERDLMFVFGTDYGEHPINPHREGLFRRGYGPVELDPTLMAYYQTERTLDDIAVFAANILDPDISDATRANELHWLRRLVED